MIADRATDTIIESNIAGVEKVEMTIDPEAFIHIMDVLSRLYSDPEKAVLREYSTNARDAMIAAGRADQPIEVTLPTILEPFLMVRDTGIGMDIDDIRRTYGHYGTSTKRDTNDQQGTLGFGSKSCFAYASQFTLIGVKDHKRIEVLISRDDPTTAPVMTVVSEIDTTECNGVTVVIPARRYNRFDELAADFFSYWEEGTVLVNGEQPKRIEGLKVGDDMLVVKDGGPHRIVMGNVAYPIESDRIDLPLKEGRLVAFVPMPQVTFAPSREALSYGKTTKETLTRIQVEFNDKAATAIQAAIDNASTPGEALRLAANWRKAIDAKDDKGEPFPYKFKGQKLPLMFHAGENDRFTISQIYSNKLSACDRREQVYVGTAVNALWVSGYDRSTTFSPALKRKLEKYVEDNNVSDVEHFILCQEIPESTWLDDKRKLDYETIKAIRLPRTYRGGAPGDRPKGSYQVMLSDTTSLAHTQADEIPDGDLYYISTTDDEEGVAYALRKHDKDAIVVFLTNNRVNKFCRDFPDAQHAREGLKDAVTAAKRRVRKRHILQFAIQQDWQLRRKLQRLDASRIDDPQVRDLIEVANDKNFDQGVKRVNEANRLAALARQKAVSTTVKLLDLDGRYPLLDNLRYGEIHPHVYLYMNAVHASKQS